jgi:hypothetical protein
MTPVSIEEFKTDYSLPLRESNKKRPAHDFDYKKTQFL